MSLLSKTVAKVRSGVFHVMFLDASGNRLGSGTAFTSRGCLVTNGHVFDVPRNSSHVWLRRDEHVNSTQGVCLTAQDFRGRRIVASPQEEYDYAVLDVPELRVFNPHQFEFSDHTKTSVGQSVAFLGYPLEHLNLTCHAGVISSLHTKASVNVIQVDASVNPSNSGGPLFLPDAGKVIGIVTRRATGLTDHFAFLRSAILKNIATFDGMHEFMSVGSFSMKQALSANQAAILQTLDQIERSANVGIGYAFSCKHLLEEADFIARTAG